MTSTVPRENAMQAKTLDLPIGVELSDIDIAELTDGDIETIHRHVHERRLVVLRDQRPSSEQYISFARRLGTPQIYFQPNYHHPEHPEIFVSSNELHEGQKFGVKGTGRYWHTDYSFMPEPLPWTMLLPKTLPEGDRETYYIDMIRVLAELPDDLRRIVEDRELVHEGKYRYKIQPSDVDRSLAEILEEVSREVPAVRHPAVIVHPATGERILYANRGFTTGIVGLGHEEAQEVLGRIFDHSERPEFVHTHRWRIGDILLWDNRSLLHMASDVPPGQKSTSYRIGIYDGLPFYEGLPVTTTQPLWA